MPPTDTAGQRPVAPRLSNLNPATDNSHLLASRQSTSTIGTYRTNTTTSTSITRPSDPEGGPRSPRIPSSGRHMPSNSSRPVPRTMSGYPGASKKKKSVFGGLFTTQEPSMAAFAQLEEQMKKQQQTTPEGRPRAVGLPGVSTSKLPANVPKVNSKWDGIPEVVKQKEKLEQERKTMHRQSTASSARLQTGDRRSGSRSQRRHSNSTLSSFDSNPTPSQRGNVSDPSDRFSISDSLNPTEASKSKHRSASLRAQSLRSPSGTSLPEITSFFPNDIPEPPSIPKRVKDLGITPIPGIEISSESQIHTSIKNTEPKQESHLDTVPEQSSSPTATPGDLSPITPLASPPFAQESQKFFVSNQYDKTPLSQPNDPYDRLAGAHSPPPPIPPLSTLRGLKSQAFLAGEAKPFEIPEDRLVPEPIASPSRMRGGRDVVAAPVLSPAARVVQMDLEKRPDSSRARLGLRASMLKTETAPWEWEQFGKEQDEPPLSPKRSNRFSLLK